MKYVMRILTSTFCLAVLALATPAMADDDDGGADFGGSDESYSAAAEEPAYEAPAEQPDQVATSQDEADRFNDDGSPKEDYVPGPAAGLSPMCQDGTNQSNICKRQRETESA